jgi:hypothetical protein
MTWLAPSGRPLPLGYQDPRMLYMYAARKEFDATLKVPGPLSVGPCMLTFLLFFFQILSDGGLRITPPQ